MVTAARQSALAEKHEELVEARERLKAIEDGFKDLQQMNIQTSFELDKAQRENLRLNGYIDRVREIDLLRADLVRPGVRTGEDPIAID